MLPAAPSKYRNYVRPRYGTTIKVLAYKEISKGYDYQPHTVDVLKWRNGKFVFATPRKIRQ